MVENILQHYFKNAAREPALSAAKRLSPDSVAYEITIDGQDYVMVESDYLFVDTLPEEIETLFQVNVLGWCSISEQNSGTLLPKKLFHNNQVNESDESWQHYHEVVYSKANRKYALLRVVRHPQQY